MDQNEQLQLMNHAVVAARNEIVKAHGEEVAAATFDAIEKMGGYHPNTLFTAVANSTPSELATGIMGDAFRGGAMSDEAWYRLRAVQKEARRKERGRR